MTLELLPFTAGLVWVYSQCTPSPGLWQRVFWWFILLFSVVQGAWWLHGFLAGDPPAPTARVQAAIGIFAFGFWRGSRRREED